MRPRVILKQGDALARLAELPDCSVDLICTDPPYESLEKHRKRGTTTRLKKSKSSSNEWFEVFPNSKFPEFLKECYRVLRPDRHCYIFCDDETSNFLWQYVMEMPKGERFKWWKRLVWRKARIGMGYHYRCRYEFIIFLEKGKRALNSNSISDVLEFPAIYGGIPGQKPIPLLRVLVENSTRKNELVVDPFMGSASAGYAAFQTGRRFTGFDLKQELVDRAQDLVDLYRGQDLNDDETPADPS